MSVIDNILHSTPINWLHKFIHLLKLDSYVCNLYNRMLIYVVRQPKIFHYN